LLKTLARIYRYNFENNVIRAPDKSAMFSVRSPSPEVVLVVRIERLLRGDVETDINAYACKAKDMSAARNQFAQVILLLFIITIILDMVIEKNKHTISQFLQETRKLAARGGSRLQPLAWAATELFGKRGWLGGRRVTMDLMVKRIDMTGAVYVL
jgi:hypothetical protein